MTDASEARAGCDGPRPITGDTTMTITLPAPDAQEIAVRRY